MKEPAILLTSDNAWNLGMMMNLTRYPEPMRENARKFDVKRSTDSWNKIRDTVPHAAESLWNRRG